MELAEMLSSNSVSEKKKRVRPRKVKKGGKIYIQSKLLFYIQRLFKKYEKKPVKGLHEFSDSFDRS